MMTNPNPVTTQHFVPCFYLKHFADEQGSLQVLNVKEKRMAKPRPYQGLGYEYYYYARKTGIPDDLSQQIENWLRPTENLLARALPGITNSILNNEHIKDKDRYILSVLMSMLWLRTPGMRRGIEQMEKQMAEQMSRFAGSEEIEQFKNVDNVTHLKFMVETMGFGGPGFANCFYAMKWKVYIAHGNETFITSDSPVVEKYPPPISFFGGGSFICRNKYFALTPKILLELTEPIGSHKIKRKTLFAADDDKVRMLNMILVSGSQNYVYSGSRKSLERLLAGRENPGYIENEYYEQYEKPWDEYRSKMKN
jgi:hypothetical protein